MTTAKNLQTSLTAILIAVFMLTPFSSNESVVKNKKMSFNTHLQVVDDGASKQTGNIDLSLPESNKKEKNKSHNEDQTKSKHHADEEKHKNHVYHYHRVKAKKKSHTTFLQICLKVFVAISFISVLLCGYMNISH
jgi:uncharacterized membrane protein YhiD involved in acid resistance